MAQDVAPWPIARSPQSDGLFEVRYLNYARSVSYQPTFLRIREDITREDYTVGQLEVRGETR